MTQAAELKGWSWSSVSWQNMKNWQKVVCVHRKLTLTLTLEIICCGARLFPKTLLLTYTDHTLCSPTLHISKTKFQQHRMIQDTEQQFIYLTNDPYPEQQLFPHKEKQVIILQQERSSTFHVFFWETREKQYLKFCVCVSVIQVCPWSWWYVYLWWWFCCLLFCCSSTESRPRPLTVSYLQTLFKTFKIH